MPGVVRVRLALEIAMGALAGVLALVTLVTRDWIEAIFGVDPDAGSGAVEWLLVAALVVVAAACGLIARAEARRYQAA